MGNSLKFMILAQFVVLAAIALDVPFVRQVAGFIYISFIPGIFILKILNLNFKSMINKISFSVGLSLAFIMFVGLIINFSYPILGISKPLESSPLLLTFGFILMLLSFVAYRDSPGFTFSLPSLTQVFGAILLLSVPLLAIFGAAFHSTQLLYLMIFFIATLVIVTIFSKRIIPPRFHVVVLATIALSLLFQTVFMSEYLVGYDIFGEFYVFKLTQANSLWSTSITVPIQQLLDYNSMLSVTILPTIYSTLLNIDGELIFRVVYVLLYALVPLIMYQMFKRPFGKPIAFLSAFYFTFFPRFYSEERRQIVGEFFLVLLISLIFIGNIKRINKNFLFVVLGAALIVSHYSIAYIFLFCVLFAYASVTILRHLPATILGHLYLPRFNLERRRFIELGPLIILVFFALFWYFFITPDIGNTTAGVISNIVSSFFQGFGSLETRGDMISDFVAPNFGNTTLVYKIDYFINKVPYFLLIVGLIGFIKKFKKMEIVIEYLPMVLSIVLILFMALVLPGFAPTFLAHRFYHVSLLFLAPISILGGVIFLELIAKPLKRLKRKRIWIMRVACVFFVLVFFFKVGLIAELSGDLATNKSVSFSRLQANNNPTLYDAYVPEHDMRSGIWLSLMKQETSEVYADAIATRHVLSAYSNISVKYEYILNNGTEIDPDNYIYLRYFNLYGLLNDGNSVVNATGVYNQLDWANKLYSNGGSEIYFSLPVNNSR